MVTEELAEVVGEEEGESPIRAAPRSDSGRACEVILGDDGTLYFVVTADVVRGHAVDNGLYFFPSALIPESNVCLTTI